MNSKLLLVYGVVVAYMAYSATTTTQGLSVASINLRGSIDLAEVERRANVKCSTRSAMFK